LLQQGSVVVISGREYPYEDRWGGRPLMPREGYLSFDTETEVVDLRRQVPRLALATASAGSEDSCLIHPDDLGRFILVHKHLRFVGQNVAFDHWVVVRHLAERGEREALAAWWRLAESGRLHDSMIADMLLRLAEDDAFPKPRDLGIVAREYAGLEVDKDDPYRQRYGEIIGVRWSEVDPRFFEYAVKDAIVTLPTYLAIRRRALAVVRAFSRDSGDIPADARERFWLLSEAVQVQKAIALAQITRTPLHVDLAWVRSAEAELRQRLGAAVDSVRSLCPDLYRTDGDGTIILTGKSQAPSKSQDVLLDQLRLVREDISREYRIELDVPLTVKLRQPTTSRKYWAEYRDLHSFLDHWITAEELIKLLQFFSQHREAEVHPRYSIMVRSGRTSCSDPNIQQIPRDSTFRQAFVASPGHFLLAVDYSFIELCTLAAHTLHRYGRSAMAEVIKRGIDPHSYTGAMMIGVSLEEFLGWKENQAVVGGKKLEDRYDDCRKAAKPINFGVPGGLGVARLRDYARSNYKVVLTEEETRKRRETLIRQVYPELDLYLSEDHVAILARALQAPAPEVRNELGEVALSSVRKILEGDPRRVDGRPYSPPFVSQVWASLAGLNRNPELSADLLARRPSAALARRVCHAGVATLTGRIRGRVGYSQARNTPFQGLAADGRPWRCLPS
jgi:hypothetical protein